MNSVQPSFQLVIIVFFCLGSLGIESSNITIELNVGDEQGCPGSIDDLPITSGTGKDKKFIAFWAYNAKGNVNPVLSCNGGAWKGVNKQRFTHKKGYCSGLGSLFVMPGCSFYGYSKIGYTGTLKKYDGPLFISDVPIIGKTTSGYSCAGSWTGSCSQEMPDCVPSDGWAAAASFDNANSKITTTFAYKITIGTSWSEKVTVGKSVSTTVEAEMKVTIEGFLFSWLKNF